MRLITSRRSKPGSLSLREARAGREPERGVPNPNGLLSPTLTCLWEEREKKLASGSPSLRFSPGIRLNLKAISNKHIRGRSVPAPCRSVSRINSGAPWRSADSASIRAGERLRTSRATDPRQYSVTPVSRSDTGDHRGQHAHFSLGAATRATTAGAGARGVGDHSDSLFQPGHRPFLQFRRTNPSLLQLDVPSRRLAASDWQHVDALDFLRQRRGPAWARYLTGTLFGQSNCG